MTAGLARALAKVAAASLRWPKKSLSLAVLLVAACAGYAAGTPLSTSRYRLAGARDDAVFRAFDDRFGRREPIVVALWGGDEAARHQAADALAERLAELPGRRDSVLGRIGLDQVAELSLLLAPGALSQLRRELGDEGLRRVIEGGVVAWVRAIRARIEATSEAAPVDEARANAGLSRLTKTLRAIDAELAGGDPMRELPRLADQVDPGSPVPIDDKGYLVSEDGATHYLLVFSGVGDEGSDAAPLVAAVRAARDQIDLGPVRASVTGLPALAADERAALRSGLWRGLLLALAAVGAGLYAAYRSFRYAAIALIAPIAASAASLAAARALFGGVDLLSAAAPLLVIGPSAWLGAHFVGGYALARAEQLPRDRAILAALHGEPPALGVAAVTALIGSSALAALGPHSVARLAAASALGLLAGAAVLLIAAPAAVWLWGRHREAKAPAPVARRSWGKAVLAWLLVGAAALLIARVLPAPARAHALPAPFDFGLSRSVESAAALDRLDRRLGIAPAIIMADDIESSRRLAARLRASGHEVASPSDALPELRPQRLAALRAGFARLPEPRWSALPAPASRRDLGAELDLLSDALDEIGMAMRRARLDQTALEQAQRAVRGLIARVGGLPDDAPIARAEAHLGKILERAWTTARAVAERGRYLPSDLPAVLRAPFVSNDGRALALYIAARPGAAADTPGATGLPEIALAQSARMETGSPLSKVCCIVILCALAMALRLGALRLVPMAAAGLALVPLTGAVADLALAIAAPIALAAGAHAGFLCRRPGARAAVAIGALAAAGFAALGFTAIAELGLALGAGSLAALAFCRDVRAKAGFAEPTGQR